MSIIQATMVEESEPVAEQKEGPREETESDETAEQEDSPQDAEAEETDGEGLLDASDDDSEDGETEEADDESEDEGDGDESDDEGDEDDTADLYAVKVDGEEREVTLDELKRGYSGQQYIQKGMEEVSEQKKALNDAIQSFQQERQSFLQFAQQAQQGGLKAPPQEPDPELLNSDPIGYMRAKHEYDQQMQEYQQEQQRIAHYQQQEQKQNQIARQRYLEEQKQQLLDEKTGIPELREDPDAFNKWVRNGAQQYFGLPQEALDGITDAAVVKALRSAIKFEELQRGKAQAKKKRSAKPATRPKGKSRPNPERQAQQKLEKAKQLQTDEAWLEFFKTG
jgi:hypothetical protein